MGLPFFGVIFSYIKSPYHWLHHNAIKYGAIMSASIGVEHNIYINDIALAKQLLMSKKKLVNYRPNKFAGRDTTSYVNGSEWHKRRKMISSSFLSLTNTSFVLKNVKFGFDQIKLNEKGNKFEWNPSFDVKYIAFNIIMSALFDRNIDYDDEFVTLWFKTVDDNFKNFGVLTILLTMTKNETIHKILCNLFKRPQVLQRLRRLQQEWMNKNGFILDFDNNNITTIDDKKYLDTKAKHKCYLDVVILALKNDEIELKKVINDILELMFVGIDTTTHTMQFGLMLLAKNKDLQNKIYNEINSVLEANNLDEFNFNILPKLHIFRAFVNDMIRLSCVVPLGLPHTNIQDITVKVNNTQYIIPKDSNIFFNISYMNRKQWKDKYNKNTENKYNGENILNKFDELYLDAWLDKNGHFKMNSNSMTFLKGQRDCLGSTLAIKIMYAVFGLLITKYRFTLNQKEYQKRKQRFGVVSSIEPSLNINVETRH